MGLGTLSGGNGRKRCQNAALASMSENRAPVTRGRMVFRSGPVGCGWRRGPTSNWSIVNPATVASLTGHRGASPWLTRGEALCGAGKAFGHAQRQAEIGGEWIPHAGGEQRTGEWIENGGVDQPGVRRQIVAADLEVGGWGENSVGEAVECGRSQRAGLRAEHKEAARLVLVGELISIDEITGRESPGGVGRGCGNDAERRIRVCRDRVRGCDQQAFRRERGSKVDENNLQLLRRHRAKQDEESGAGPCGSGGEVGD